MDDRSAHRPIGIACREDGPLPRTPITLIVAIMTLFGATPAGRSQDPARTTNDGVFNVEQVGRGEAVYLEVCSVCHLDDLAGYDRFPPLVGDGFFDKWIGGDVAAFVERMRSMPEGAPTSLTEADYVDVAAFLLSASGVPRGDEELPTDLEGLRATRIDKPE